MRYAHKGNRCEQFRGRCLSQVLDSFSHGGTEARRESQGGVPSSGSRIQSVLYLCALVPL